MPKTKHAAKSKAKAAKPETPKRKRTKSTKSLHPCECGCGTMVAMRFAQGHDGKLKARLMAALRSDESTAGEKAKAKAQLVKLGWYREGIENPKPSRPRKSGK